MFQQLHIVQLPCPNMSLMVNNNLPTTFQQLYTQHKTKQVLHFKIMYPIQK
jgi:predicted secreted protein